MNSYELSRAWFDYSFLNPDKVKPLHTAIYFFAIEHCNRLGWKDKFGFPSQMVMEAIGVKNWRTYSNGLNDLVDFGFIKMIEISRNQYSSNIIAIVKNTKAPTKALDKALSKHGTKQSQSTVSIDKQDNNITKNKEQDTPTAFESEETFLEYFNKAKKHFTNVEGKFKVMSKRDSNNFKTLNKSYTRQDFTKAITMMSKSKWVNDNKMFNISHFLANDNFNRYLNQEDNTDLRISLNQPVN